MTGGHNCCREKRRQLECLEREPPWENKTKQNMKELGELARIYYLGEEDSTKREWVKGTVLVLSAVFEESMETSVAGMRRREAGSEAGEGPWCEGERHCQHPGFPVMCEIESYQIIGLDKQHVFFLKHLFGWVLTVYWRGR